MQGAYDYPILFVRDRKRRSRETVFFNEKIVKKEKKKKKKKKEKKELHLNSTCYWQPNRRLLSEIRQPLKGNRYDRHYNDIHHSNCVK